MKIASPQIHASKSVALPSPTGHYLELSRVPALLSVRTKDTEILLQYLVLVQTVFFPILIDLSPPPSSPSIYHLFPSFLLLFLDMPPKKDVPKVKPSSSKILEDKVSLCP